MEKVGVCVCSYAYFVNEWSGKRKEKERENKEKKGCHVIPLGASHKAINAALSVQAELQCQPHSTPSAIVTEVNLNNGVHGILARIWMENRQ